MANAEVAGSERFAAISKLPVFLDLSGRKAVLAGNTPGLAWKAELIAAAGAHVLLLAPEPSAEIDALLARGGASGSLALERRRWADSDLRGAAIAVADAETLAEAAAFKKAGEAAGVIVNTIDKGATCDFYFGAIVSRSPIMIGCTTDGTAPILGQAIRRAIELAVPRWLADWAEFARAIRADVKRRLAPGWPRRAFWEAFTERSLAGPLDEAGKADVLAHVEKLAASARAATGERHDVAAPHCADLLRLGEVKLLQAADVLIEEPGVAPDIRAFYRREATRLRIDDSGVAGTVSPGRLEAAVAEFVAGSRRVVVIRAMRQGDPACCRASQQSLQVA